MRPGLHGRPARQGGVAIVTALLLTALALSVVAGLFWQQQLRVRSIEHQRTLMQRRWLLNGALDWARLILREDAKGAEVDHLHEAWARPLPPTRMDQFLRSGEQGDELGAMTLSGAIVDAQALLDVNALAAAGVPDPVRLKSLEQLLATLRLDPQLAPAIAEQVARRQRGNAAATGLPVLPMEQLNDLLAVPGISPAVLRLLDGKVAFLPARSPLNLNTADVDVLAASLPPQLAAAARTIVDDRRRAPFRDLEDFRERLPALAGAAEPSRFGVASRFFLVSGRLASHDGTTVLRGLVERTGGSTRLWWACES